MNRQHWLPSSQQMSSAAQLRSSAYQESTMQQALGMIVLLALLAGFLPFVVHWFVAARFGTVLPLAQASSAAARTEETLLEMGFALPGLVNPRAMSDFYQTLAGLEQPLPGWLAAGLSALGEWLNWPLQWLTLWIVYGALVMIANKALGGHIILQRFYAATGFAAVPLLLTGLSPIPCLGGLATLGGIGWSLAVYIRANAEITGFDLPRSMAAVLLPAPILALLLLFVAGIVAAFAAMWII